MIRRFALIAILILFVPVLLGVKPARADEITLEQVLDGLEVRLDAIHSGRIVFQLDGIKVPSANGSRPFPWSEPAPGALKSGDIVKDFTLAGDEYVIRYRGFPNVGVCRSDYDASLYTIDDNEQTPVQRLELKNSRLKPFRETMKTDFMAGVFKAGAVPSREVVTYLRKRRDDITMSISTDAEHRTTATLKLTVPAEDGPAVECLHSELKPGELFQTTLVVATDCGFLLRSLDHSKASGEMLMRWVADGDTKVADGIWFPKAYYSFYSNLHTQNPSVYVEQYVIHEVSLVNEQIPAEMFAITIPEGTAVNDMRSGGTDVSFFAASSTIMNNPDDVLRLRAVPARESRRVSIRSTLIWVNVILLAAWASILLLRAKKRLK